MDVLGFRQFRNKMAWLIILVALLGHTVDVVGIMQSYYAESVLAFSTQLNTDEYTAAEILGAPNVYPSNVQSPRSWSHSARSPTQEYIELQFPESLSIESINIYEPFNYGAIVKISAMIPFNRTWFVLYNGSALVDPPGSRNFSPPLTPTSFYSSVVRLDLDCQSTNTWCQIDAVQVTGFTKPFTGSGSCVSPENFPNVVVNTSPLNMSLYAVLNISCSTGAFEHGWTQMKTECLLAPNGSAMWNPDPSLGCTLGPPCSDPLFFPNVKVLSGWKRTNAYINNSQVLLSCTEGLFNDTFETATATCIQLIQYSYWTPSVVTLGCQQDWTVDNAPQYLHYAESVLSFSTQNADRPATMVLGPTDVYPSYGDINKTWCPSPNIWPSYSADYLILQYPETLYIKDIFIYETMDSGRTVSISALRSFNATWEVLWSGTIWPLNMSRIFVPPLSSMNFLTNVVKIDVDSYDASSEIDAVHVRGVKWNNLIAALEESCVSPANFPNVTIQSASPNLFLNSRVTVSCQIGNFIYGNYSWSSMRIQCVIGLNGSPMWEPDISLGCLDLQWVTLVLNVSPEQQQDPPVSNIQIVGAPDVYPNYCNSMYAWSFSIGMAPNESIELQFANSTYINAIFIYETCNPGGVVAISAQRDDDLTWVQLWNGTAEMNYSESSRIFSPPLQHVTFLSRVVRLDIECPYCDIDAVQIRGAYSLPLQDQPTTQQPTIPETTAENPVTTHQVTAHSMTTQPETTTVNPVTTAANPVTTHQVTTAVHPVITTANPVTTTVSASSTGNQGQSSTISTITTGSSTTTSLLSTVTTTATYIISDPIFRNASVSSWYNEHHPRLGVDGDHKSCTISGLHRSPWYRIRLTQQTMVKSVYIYNLQADYFPRSTQPVELTIYISNGRDKQFCNTVSGLHETSDHEIFCDKPIRGSIIEITAQCPTYCQLKLCEVVIQSDP